MWNLSISFIVLLIIMVIAFCKSKIPTDVDLWGEEIE